MTILIAFAALSPLPAEFDEVFARYETCIISEAVAFASVPASIDEVYLASKASCSFQYGSMMVTLALHEGTKAIEEGNISSVNYFYEPQAYFENKLIELRTNLSRAVLLERKTIGLTFCRIGTENDRP